MSERGLVDTPPFEQPETSVSAPSSADFYLQNEVDNIEPSIPPPIADVLLNPDRTHQREMYLDAVCDLHSYMKDILRSQRDFFDRNQAASWYAAKYRAELDVDSQTLNPDQRSAQVLSRLYLSSVNSLAELGVFLQTIRWMGRKSEEVEAAKIVYLRTRKDFQDDVDAYFDHFRGERTATIQEALMDTVNMARLLVSRRSWVDAKTHTHSHIFVGSILSERMIKLGVQNNGHPQPRYGDENEDRSPTKADVVLPREDGDFHVQVKMRWKRPRQFEIKPNKRPLHVYVPMGKLRTELTKKERRQLNASIRQKIAERATLQTGVDLVESMA